MNQFYKMLLSFFITQLSSVIYAGDLWVSKTGTQDTCGPTEDLACTSIQQALSVAGPGDTILITAGTYTEDSSTSPHVNKCYWIDSSYASLCAVGSGTALAPITLTAAPGSERRVIVDSQNDRIGLHLLKADYIHVKNMVFVNNFIIGIGSWGQVQNEIANQDTLGIGIRIENNKILDTNGPYGLNVSGLGMWGSKDWVVKNNYIQNVHSEQSREASCIQAYGVINALIENNDLIDCASGIFWKDHFIENISRDPVIESEIRYNNINAYSSGVQIGIRGSGSVEAGHNYIHHNYIHGFSGSGIYGNMAAAHSISASLTIEHNLFNGDGSSTKAITLDAFDSVAIKGNLFLDVGIDIEIIKYSDTKIVIVKKSDYNVFDNSFKAVTARYSTSEKTYDSLALWNRIVSSDSVNFGISNPDSNSVSNPITNIVETNGLTYKQTSPAYRMMPDNSNAGPIQFGNEVIGSSFVRPKAPSNVIFTSN